MMVISCGECGIGHYHALFPGSAYGTCLSCGHMVHVGIDVQPTLGPGKTVEVGDGGFLQVVAL